MAETAIGVVGLLGLFTTAVDCFNRVRLAKQFDGDFAFSQLNLVVASDRFSRWGEAAGICEGSTTTYPEDQIKKAEKALDMIVKAFTDARDMVEALGGDINALTYSPDDLTGAPVVIHKGLSASIGKRINRKFAHVTNQTKWAIYKKTELTSLIKKIEKLVDHLESLLPAGPHTPDMFTQKQAEHTREESQRTLQKFADIEVEEIHDLAVSMQDMVVATPRHTEVTPLQVAETLQEVVRGPDSSDPYLEKAVETILERLQPQSGSNTGRNYSGTLRDVQAKGGMVGLHVEGGSVTNHWGGTT
jgi:hypothetical protein